MALGANPQDLAGRADHVKLPLRVLAMVVAFLSPVLMVAKFAPSHVEARIDLVRLGHELFRSTLLSVDGSTACSSCHIPSLDFSGDRAKPIGAHSVILNRRAPSLAAVTPDGPMRWDGAISGLDAQISLPLQSPEMAIDWDKSLAVLRKSNLAGVDADLRESVDRGIVLSALRAYVLSLSLRRSRFDSFFFKHDDSALTEEEKLGFRLFTRKAHCSSCHLLEGNSSPFTDGAFHSTSVGDSRLDIGRAAVTGDPRDVGAFKTPSLRGVALRPLLMHDGSITDLRAAVSRYNTLMSPGADPRLRPLYLSQSDIDAIVAFLQTLTPDQER